MPILDFQKIVFSYFHIYSLFRNVTWGAKPPNVREGIACEWHLTRNVAKIALLVGYPSLTVTTNLAVYWVYYQSQEINRCRLSILIR